MNEDKPAENREISHEGEFTEENNYTDSQQHNYQDFQPEYYPTDQNVDYHGYSYGTPTMHQQTAYGASNGPVYYESFMNQLDYGGYPPHQQTPPGYVDQYGQFVPFQAHAMYHHQHQQYFNAPRGPHGHRGGRMRRGGRGRGKGPFRNQYYDYNYNNDDYGENVNRYGGSMEPDEIELKARDVKPKQFSYQGNRYRENRKRTSNNASENSIKSYSLLRNRNGELVETKPGRNINSESLEPEDFYNAGFNEKENDEFSYAEKTEDSMGERSTTSRSKGYSSQRNPRGRYTQDYSNSGPKRNEQTKFNRARGGYNNAKRNNIEYSHEMGRDEHLKRKGTSESGQEGSKMNTLRGKGVKSVGKNMGRNVGEAEKGKMSYGVHKKYQDSGKNENAEKNRSHSNRGKKFHFKGDQDDETQRGLLIEQLSNNSYECMVCCETVRRDAAIWNCSNCYHAFHLRCIKKWARSPTAAVEGQTGWRCPACQNVCPQVPNQYRCFCGKVRDPDNSRYETPHSCGEICGKLRPSGCPHPCNILCHPGPCPTCQATINKTCNCGQFNMTVKCGQAPAIKCQEVCGKTLNCGRHECQTVCHEGSCKPCDEKIQQECFCSADNREVVCGSAESFSKSYSCEGICGRKLDCGNHNCEASCHPGTCDPCRLSPDLVQFCPCLKTPLSELIRPGEERRSCLDPIPTCDRTCDKELACGPADSPHKCQALCHTGGCGACSEDTEITCKCGALVKAVPCAELDQYTGANQFTCDKRCNKKRDCGRHRCTQLCCVDTEHKCDIICGRKLSCGLHRCEEPCHRGNCHTCWQVSFEELRCYCGSEVLYPPVACGQKPPECKKKCTRMHPCGHDVLHNCHSEETCPPCTALTEKWCQGKHEYRKNIACHLTDITCGMKCSRPLPCGQHKCQQICHKGDCLAEGEKCTQPCTKLRESCGHTCSAPCHHGEPCPNIPCRAEIMLKCECGNRSEKSVCQVSAEEKSAQEYQRLATSMLAMRMSDARDGQTIDITSLMAAGKEQSSKPRKLECSSECAIRERNRRLALALEIKNPDISSKLGNPPYTEFLKEYAKKSPSFVSGIEKAFSELVQTAQKSVKKYRSHAFAPMNRDQRRVIHELAEFYGCSTQSYDEEPKKNVVASAYKDKCWIPSVTLTSLVQRELHPKAPVPIPHRSSEEQIRSTVQASKQSTQLVGTTTKSGSTWHSKTTKPLNSWTTLKSSKSASTSSSSSPRSSQGQDSNEPMREQETGSKSAWGNYGMAASSQVKSTSAWGQSSSLANKKEEPAKKKAEPVIDYFEMTD